MWQKRLDRFDVLMDEDYVNLEPIQRSMEHAVHGGQVINYQERRIWHVHAWIDKVIGQEHIAEHLRVPDLLADWVEKGIAPGKSVKVTAGQKSLPMCSYPEYPKYLKGAADAAESYQCSAK